MTCANRAGAALCAALGALGLAAVLMSAPAIADTPPGSDGSCGTRPTSYPANGVPLPPEAECTLVVDDLGTPAAELWAWRDASTANWYNYAVDGVTFDASTALAMCGAYYPLLPQRQQRAAAICTPDSADLIFTAPNVFVALRLAADADLTFCETLSLLTPSVEPATACGVVTKADAGVPTTSPAPPASQPPPFDEASPTANPPPSTAPAEPPAQTLLPSPPGNDGGTTAEHQTSTPATSAVDAQPGTGGGAAGDPASSPAVPGATVPSRHRADDLMVLATPDADTKVATVAGRQFPTRAAVTLAAALGLFGVLMLLVPSWREVRRRRVG